MYSYSGIRIPLLAIAPTITMKFEDHCKECKEKLGHEFEVVHKFLDQHFKDFKYDHRRVFHHTYGIELVRYFWGDLAAKAAELHIRGDFNGELPSIEDWLNKDHYLNT